MAIFNLRWFCFAFYFVPLVSFAQLVPGTGVATEVAAGTTTYRVVSSTISAPSNVAVSAARDITPYVSKIPSGLAQTAQGDLIVATKARVPFSGMFNISTPVLKEGAKLVLRRSPVVVAGAVGLQALLDSVDWSVVDGEVTKPVGGADPSLPSDWGSAPVGVTYANGGEVFSSLESAATFAVNRTCSTLPVPRTCSVTGLVNNTGSPDCLSTMKNNCQVRPLAKRTDNGATVTITSPITVRNPTNTLDCSSGFIFSPDFFGCVSSSTGSQPVSETDIDDLVSSSYDPEPEDLPVLFPYVYPDSFTVFPVPSVSLEPTVTTETDSVTGSDTVTEVSESFDFTVKENDSVQPEADLEEITNTKTYVNGTLVSNNSTSTKRPAIPSVNNPSSPSTGSGSGSDSPSIEFPVFCSWASILCDWVGWTQEPVDAEPDLSGILSDLSDLERTKDISFGNKVCPADIPLDIDFLGITVMLSFYWFCELASIIYFMVLAGSYVFAAYITLGVARG